MQLFVDQLTNVDFSFLDAKRGLVGETWLANFCLTGTLDATGMICDFGIVKSTLRQWLDDQIDHKLAVPTLSPQLEYDVTDTDIELKWRYSGGVIAMTAPLQAVALIPTTEITPITGAEWVKNQVSQLLPGDVQELALDFSVENITGSYYHYSHGLKKHNGNCQRIAHGHRSTIEIWLDDNRATELEQEWSERWRDIYLATQEDLEAELNNEFVFAYQSQQGDFKLSIPKQHCYLINQDTTVENIARYLCQTIKQANPNHRVKVKAYEGIGKGAIFIL